MKNSVDLYTKTVLTVIAIALIANLLKGSDLVTKAHAKELDLSSLNLEAEASAEGTVFFVFENSRISSPVSTSESKWLGSSTSGNIGDKDIPKYIITNKRGYVSLK